MLRSLCMPQGICKQVHNYRDYLIASQIQGYAVLSTALNYANNHPTVHKLAEIGFERLKQQEKKLGGRFNDW